MTRRGVLAAGAAAIAGAPVLTSALAACGGSSGDSGGPVGGTTSGPVTLPAADVPVGGGKILGAQQVVVAQPTAGEFKAYSAVCTHQGCIVANVSGGRINCTCHNSSFSIADGSVQSGPATRALPAKTVTVDGGTLTVT